MVEAAPDELSADWRRSMVAHETPATMARLRKVRKCMVGADDVRG